MITETFLPLWKIQSGEIALWIYHFGEKVWEEIISPEGNQIRDMRVKWKCPLFADVYIVEVSSKNQVYITMDL